MLEPAPFTPRFTTAWVDRSAPEHIFHYFRQYDRLNAVFGYDLRVEPIQGTDQIRCTLTTLTDPIDQPPDKFQKLGLGLRNKSMPVVEHSRRFESFRDQVRRCNSDHDASARSRQDCRGPISSPDPD